MSFLGPTAPEVCWSSAWKQDRATPRKSCYCAELPWIKDLLGFLKEEKVAFSVQATTFVTTCITLILMC